MAMSAQLASASPVPAPECVVINVLGILTVLGVAKSQLNQLSLPSRRAVSTASSSMMVSRSGVTRSPGSSTLSAASTAGRNSERARAGSMYALIRATSS